MMNEIIFNTIEKAPKVPFNLDGKILFASEKFEIIHLTLNPGDKIDQHAQPFDVLFFVLAGQGTLECDTRLLDGNENTTIFVPAGTLRGWENTGKTVLKLLVIKDLV
jgi:mannose-6-phosphate isomerase-like protein (cupin superfamily)